MENTLLQNLLGFYEEDPTDPFNIYALALEYLKSDENKAAFFFNLLLNDHPGYLPTYYHAASFFASSQNLDKAENTYQTGIKLALDQNNSKTHQELLRAYRNFLDDLED